MSAEDVAKLLHLNPTVTSEEVAKLITELQGFRDPIDEDFSLELGIQSEETRLRQESHIIGPDVIKPQNRTHFATRLGTVMIRKIADPVDFYPLVHTSNSFSGIKFPAVDTKYGGRIDWDGTGYITIADQARLNQTDKLTIMGWLRLPTSGANPRILQKGTTNSPYEINIDATDRLRFKVRTTDATDYSINFTYTPDTWFHFVMTWLGSSTRLRLYIDGVKQGGDITTGGTLVANALALGIGADGSGANKIINNSRCAWLCMEHDELTQAQVTDNFNGILDTDAYEEITCIPFTGYEDPEPESTLGLPII